MSDMTDLTPQDVRERSANNCAVCNGEGTYPIINRYGSHVYNIACPECDGEPSAMLGAAGGG